MSANTVAVWERGVQPIPHWVTLLKTSAEEFSSRFLEAEARHSDVQAKAAARLEEVQAKAAAQDAARVKEIRRLNEKIVELGTELLKAERHTDSLREVQDENKRLKRRMKELERLLDMVDLARPGSLSGKDSGEQVFKRLAKKYHPDQHPHHAEVMKDLNELYQAMRSKR